MATLNHEIVTTEQATSTESRQVSKRRSTRVIIDFPVKIFGQSADGRIFEENTKTVSVSAHGALVTVKSEIDPQKPALLMNIRIGTESTCRVAHRKEIAKDQFEIGLEFVSPFPKFWSMNFPPEDWNPADRKKATGPNPTGSR